MCDDAAEESIMPKSLKERVTIRRNRAQKQVAEMDVFLKHLEEHPELEEFAELASKY